MARRITHRLAAGVVSFVVALAAVFAYPAAADRFNLFGSAEGILKSCLHGSTCWQTQSATGADVITLWSGTCDAGTFLRGDGTCAPAGGGGGGDVYAANTNVFTNAGSAVLAPITLSSAGPKLFWNATGAAADQRLWRDYVQGTTRLFDVATDLGSQQFTYGELTRSATGIDHMAWSAEGAISLNAPLVAASGDMDVTGALTVGSCTGCSTPITPAALTRTDDTNVTLTLGGSPSTALVNAASITAGWTGQLGVARGGSGAATLTGLLQGNGTGAFTAITNSSTVGQVLRTTGASAYGWGALNLASANAITGLLPDANLSANVPLLNAANVFTAVAGQTTPAVEISSGGTTPTNGVYLSGSALAFPVGGTARFTLSTTTGAFTGSLVANNVAANGGTVPSTGIYRPGTNRLGFSSNTTYRGEFDASGNLLVSGGNYMLTSTTPRFVYNESDATTDEKIWHEQVDTKMYTLGTRTDADAAGRNAIAVTRGTGVAVTGVSLGNATDNTLTTVEGTAGLSAQALALVTGGTAPANGWYLNSTILTGRTGSSSRFSLSTSALSITVPTTATAFIVNGSTVPANGIYLPGASRLGFASNGTYRGEFDAAGQFVVGTVGAGLSVKEGSNAKQGVATLVGGTVVVSNTAVTANSRIFLTAQSLGTVVLPSACAVSARTASTSFTILCDQPTDTSVMAYEIFEPSP